MLIVQQHRPVADAAQDPLHRAQQRLVLRRVEGRAEPRADEELQDGREPHCGLAQADGCGRAQSGGGVERNGVGGVGQSGCLFKGIGTGVRKKGEDGGRRSGWICGVDLRDDDR